MTVLMATNVARMANHSEFRSFLREENARGDGHAGEAHADSLTASAALVWVTCFQFAVRPSEMSMMPLM